MAILVYTESEQGKFKKTVFELASYARAIADENNTTVTIKKADFTIKMIELQDESFLVTLRKKLLWGEDKRN